VRIRHRRILSQSRREWSSIIIWAFPSVVNLKEIQLTHYPTLQELWLKHIFSCYLSQKAATIEVFHSMEIQIGRGLWILL
jgi:hypothetical protein